MSEREGGTTRDGHGQAVSRGGKSSVDDTPVETAPEEPREVAPAKGTLPEMAFISANTLDTEKERCAMIKNSDAERTFPSSKEAMAWNGSFIDSRMPKSLENESGCSFQSAIIL